MSPACVRRGSPGADPDAPLHHNRDELVELLTQRAICTIGSYETGTA